jgi:hypothetical protein
MATNADSDEMVRIRALEQQVQELRARLAVLEKLVVPRAEHPTDRTVVREKVTYDWQ